MNLPRNYRYYRLLAALLSPVAGLWLLRELWVFRQLQHLRDRLGLTPPRRVDVWIHCASVGEVNAITPLIKALLAQGQQIHLSTFTVSGQRQAQRRLGSEYNISFSLLALDWRHAVRRQLSRIQSPELWLVETEIWPTLIVEARRLARTVRLVNGRLSRKTLASPPAWQNLLADLLNQMYSQRLLRSEEDHTMLAQLGMTAPAILCGNLKRCDVWPTDFPRLHPRPYVLLASSHADEEIELARRWQAHPELPELIIVPRHPQRGKTLVAQFERAGLTVHQRSVNLAAPSQSRYLLADTFGELPAWMAQAELVVMGGTFAPKGGQNPLEAVYFGKMVLCGPDMRDFEEETRDLTRIGVLRQCPDMDQLLIETEALLREPRALQENGQRGQRWLESERQTILERVMSALLQNVAEPEPSKART